VAADPIAVADVVLDAALAADAQTIVIEPAQELGRHAIVVSRDGEQLAKSVIDTALAAHVVARLGYVCQVDRTDKRASIGRARVRSADTQRDVIMTIRAGATPRAELLFVPCDALVSAAPGERIGHYRVIAPIGRGGMGHVFEVVHEKLGRRHALKILQDVVRDRDAEAIDRFLHEAQAAARIRCPHIVEVFDFGYLTDGRPYIVMELLGGSNLAKLIDGGPLPVARAVSLAGQLARALRSAHERDVIHADVTPANVIVVDGHLKLIDFGLAQLADRERPDGPSEFVSGTPSYLAPERIRGMPADEASDQYAFGAVLFEMLIGTPPFTGLTVEEICTGHLRAPVPALPAIPARLAAIVTRCLAKRAAERFPSMHGVLDQLLAFDAGAAG
jgi:serine/threonine-protein kinase